MLSSLLIKNYALIDQLQIEFNEKFVTLTGETGAGKSIILGALSLILGQRFDNDLLYDKNKKCVVEGIFVIQEQVRHLFEENDLDFEKESVFRREISPTGKSRAFINDTPVNLNLLKNISEKIIDIHSQHHTLKLKDHDFQLEVLDLFAGNKEDLNHYKKLFLVYRERIRSVDKLREAADAAKKDLDYFKYQFEQLDTANLKEDELDNLEEEYQMLIHAEDVKKVLFEMSQLISGEESILERLKHMQNSINSIVNYYSDAKGYLERLESIQIELKDIGDEAYGKHESIDYDPARIALLSERLNTINELLQKHSVDSVSELIKIREEYRTKIDSVESFDQEIKQATKEIEEINNELEISADKLHESRENVIPEIEETLIRLLKQLGIPHANVKIILEPQEELSGTGKDHVRILFSANKDSAPNEIAKVASGGELSRMMLAIKALISRFEKLPTMIFDEIDMGVSGDIADKMGNIMKQIAANNQVISITHLPQIASKGEEHFMVYKSNENGRSETKIRLLNRDERITELAKMLSGDKISDAAIANAKELLGA